MNHLKNLLYYLQGEENSGFELITDHLVWVPLIHYTNVADTILREGFRNCVNDMTKLHLTRWCGPKKRGDHGFVFAFREGSLSCQNGIGKYGNESLLIEAPSIAVWHYADQEVQHITHTSVIVSASAIQ